MVKTVFRLVGLAFVFLFVYCADLILSSSDAETNDGGGKSLLKPFANQASADVPSCDAGSCDGGAGCGTCDGGGASDSSGGPGCGCFAKGTRVLMADGSYKAIESVVVGDRVKSFDAAGNLTDGEVVETHIREKKNVLVVNQLTVTPDHVFVTMGNTWKKIHEFEVGDMLVTTTGDSQEVVKKEEGPSQDVFNLTVEPHHTYIVEDIRVHNES